LSKKVKTKANAPLLLSGQRTITINQHQLCLR